MICFHCESSEKTPKAIIRREYLCRSCCQIHRQGDKLFSAHLPLRRGPMRETAVKVSDILLLEHR